MSSVIVRFGQAIAVVAALLLMIWLGGIVRQFFWGVHDVESQGSNAAAKRPPDSPIQPELGSGIIVGTVIGADGRVVPYAEINGRGPILIQGRADAAGRYRVEQLRDGEYELTAAGGGYVALAWGQNATHEPAARVPVASNRVSTADFVLPLGGTVSGVVADLTGNPISEVSVAIESLPARPRPKDVRRWVAPDSERRERTDSRGRFSFDGLEPGDYLVTARAGFDFPDPAGAGLRLIGPVSSSDPFPRGVTVRVSAGTVERINLKMRAAAIRLLPGRITVDGRGGAKGTAHVRLVEDDTMRLAAVSQSSSDGTFVLKGTFLAGTYYLIASSQERDERPNGARTILQGSKKIFLNGSDSDQIELPMVRGSQLTGRIEFESATGRQGEPKFKVFMVPKRPLGTLAGSIGVTPNAAGEFALSGVPESGYLVTDLSPESGFAVSGLFLNGTDILPHGVETGQTGLRLKLTNRLGALSGSVVSSGQRFPFAIIVVVSEDRSKWSDPMSRFVRVERGSQDGSFFVKGLLPGNYHVIALSQIEKYAADDDAKLTALLPGSTRVTLAEGAATIQNLTIVR